jgi:hypothetical protein
VFNNHHAATTRAGAITDHGPAKGLIHNMIFRKDGKPTSQLSDVRDAIASNPSAVTGAADRSSNCVGSSSRPLSRTMSSVSASTRFALSNHHLLSRWRNASGNNDYHLNGDANTTSSHPLVTSDALGARLEVHFAVYIYH